MAAGLHGSARTTPRVRAELQRSQEATRRLAARYGLNPKTVAKWRRRSLHRRRANGTISAPQLGAHRGRGGHRRRVPSPHAAAAWTTCWAACARPSPGSRAVLCTVASHVTASPACPGTRRGRPAQALRRDQDWLRPHRRLRVALDQIVNLLFTLRRLTIKGQIAALRGHDNFVPANCPRSVHL